MLTHVFCVQVTADAKTNERANKLVDRMANDWHAPLSMTIPIDKVVSIKVVGLNSTAAKLIAEEAGKGK